MTNADRIVPANDLLSVQLALQIARGAALNLLWNRPPTKSPKMDPVRTWMWPDHSTVAMERFPFHFDRDLSNAHELEINWEDRAPAKF